MQGTADVAGSFQPLLKRRSLLVDRLLVLAELFLHGFGQVLIRLEQFLQSLHVGKCVLVRFLIRPSIQESRHASHRLAADVGVFIGVIHEL